MNFQLDPCQKPLIKKMIIMFLIDFHFPCFEPPSGIYKYRWKLSGMREKKSVIFFSGFRYTKWVPKKIEFFLFSRFRYANWIPKKLGYFFSGFRYTKWVSKKRKTYMYIYTYIYIYIYIYIYMRCIYISKMNVEAS